MFLTSARRLSTTVKRCLNTTIKNVTVDQKEMDLFADLSKIWWDYEGPMKFLHTMTPCRVQILREFLQKNGKIPPNQDTMEQPLKGLSILDVGCGGGILSEYVAKLGAQVVAIDCNEDMLKCAQAHLQTQGNLKDQLSYVYDTIENYSQEKADFFDVVVCSEVIEHVVEKDVFVKYTLKCLKKGGSAYFTTPNRTWPSGVYSILLGETFLGFAPKGTHQYDKFITPREMQEMMAKCGIFSEYVGKLGAQVVGLDCNESLVDCAQNHVQTQDNLKDKVTYVNDTIENYSQGKAESFDVVICSEVIEHVVEKEVLMKHSLDCLKTGGSAFFTTMNRSWPAGFYYIVLLEYVLRRWPIGSHEYHMFMTPKEMQDMFAKYKCETTDVQGFTFNLFNKTWFQLNSPNFNYAMHAIKV